MSDIHIGPDVYRAVRKARQYLNREPNVLVMLYGMVAAGVGLWWLLVLFGLGAFG